MNEQVRALLDKYPEEIAELFVQLRQLILDSTPCEPAEALWARMPTYTAGSAFIRLIPFKDHINVEASAVLAHRDALSGFKLTPKGMLQLYTEQEIPRAALLEIFADTLSADASRTEPQ